MKKEEDVVVDDLLAKVVASAISARKLSPVIPMVSETLSGRTYRHSGRSG